MGGRGVKEESVSVLLLLRKPLDIGHSTVAVSSSVH